MVVINSNMAALRAQSSLGKATSKLSASIERLSSGQRINSAADDPGGIARSVSLGNQARSFAIAERNALNGTSMVETAESAYDAVQGSFLRMRELAMQSANGDLNSDDRSNLSLEYVDLMSETKRTILTSEYNGQMLMAGPLVKVAFQVGINATNDDTVVVQFGGIGASKNIGFVYGSNIGSQLGARKAIDRLDAAIEEISGTRVKYGSKVNRLRTAQSNANQARVNLTAANSRITDVDVAEEAARLASSQIQQQAAASITAQALQAPRLSLSLLS